VEHLFSENYTRVDDEPTQLMLLRLALTRAGIVLEAPDGQKGVEMTAEHQRRWLCWT
jgi:DNA-binding response OmpR family regulator